MRTITKRLGGGATFTAALVLTAVLIIMSPAQTRAQWAAPTPGSTDISNTNGGNVGIGTGSTTLADRLTVDGTVSVRRSSPNKAELRIYNGGATAEWSFRQASGTSHNLNISKLSSGSYADYFTIDTTGRVGFGTASPVARFDVRQTGNSGAYATLLTSYGASEDTFVRGGSSSAAVHIGDVTATTSKLLLMENGGNVGVGTNSPANALHVHNAFGEGFMRVSGAGLGAVNFVDTNAPQDQKLYQWRSEGGLFRMSLANDGNTGPVRQDILVADHLGNVGIGTASPGANYRLDVNGQAHFSGDMTVDGNIAAKYQDVAEWVPSTQKLQAGTVVVLDSERTNHVLASTSAYDTKVAGVISDSPGVILGQGGEDKLKVATTGRVKVKVDATRAPIKVGDLLVTSDVQGVAMRSEPVEIGGRKMHAPGTIIGKALESLEKGTGEILVLLSLQ